MDVFEAIRTRRSIRAYKDEPVELELVERIIDAARYAPSGANLQPWKFIVVTNNEARQKIGAGAKFYFIKSHHVNEAPVLIACLADMKKSKWAIIDTSLACQNLMLAAHALGLGTCFVGVFNEEETKDLLGVPDNYKVIGLITLGYPEGQEATPSRISVENIVSYESFSGETRAGRFFSYTKSGPLTVIRKIAKMIFHFSPGSKR